jgi:hypothetical protein
MVIRMKVSFLETIRQFFLRRQLLPEEKTILAAAREKYPAHPNDVIFFIREKRPILPVRSSALIQVWGNHGEGPWVHLTNLAGFMERGMSLEEIKKTQM